MSDLIFVTSRVLTRDGLGYKLSVYRNSGGFIPVWDCQSCDYEGNGIAPLPDCDGAIKAGRLQIEQHHAQHHSF